MTCNYMNSPGVLLREPLQLTIAYQERYILQSHTFISDEIEKHRPYISVCKCPYPVIVTVTYLKPSAYIAGFMFDLCSFAHVYM